MKDNIFLLTLFILSSVVFSQNPAQWRGPLRNGVYPDTNLMKSWPESGPVMRWAVRGLGSSFSSMVVTGDAVFTVGMKDSTDVLFKVSKSGEILWEIPFGKSWTGSVEGTRGTPTVEAGRAYILSGSGIMACIDVEKGKILWTLDAVKKFDGRWGDWGICESLVLTGDKLIYTPAGPRTTMVALNKQTGELVWESESLNDTSAYVSPIRIEQGGKEIIVNLLSRHLIGVDASDGKILWKYDYASLRPEKGLEIWPGAPFTNTITPLYHEGKIYITGGYEHVGAMFKLDDNGSAIHLLWIDSTLDCHHGGVVLVNGYIYGSNWISNASGNWCCIDWETGKTRYEEKWFTKGSIITADGMLYCYEEKNGNIGLVRATPEKFDLISRFRISEGRGPHWSHPVIGEGILYIRHGEVLMAFDLRNN